MGRGKGRGPVGQLTSFTPRETRWGGDVSGGERADPLDLPTAHPYPTPRPLFAHPRYAGTPAPMSSVP